jgi:adenylosuccinate lyase
MSEMPFMATENILMEAVKRGGDRQALHERIRGHSMAAALAVKDEGAPNDLLKRVASDPAFNLGEDDIEGLLDPYDYTGRSADQVSEFIREYVEPVLEAHKGDARAFSELRV